VRILGLSYDFHDGAAALVCNGEVVGVAAEERFSLIKHDRSYPGLAVSALLREHGVSGAELDGIAYYERPSLKYTRILTTGFARFPRGAGRFIAANKEWLREKLWVRAALCSRFNLPPRKVCLVPHHEAHAAQAFLASSFERSAILVLDGVGEWDCTTLALGDRRAPNSLQILERYEYPMSIGLVYAAFTAYLGFEPNSGEASTMALAGFGVPRYVAEVSRVLQPLPDGTYRVDDSFLDFEARGSGLFSRKFIDMFGPPRDFRRQYAFDALKDHQEGVSQDDQRCADIAASLQEVLAETLLGLCRRLRRRTDSPNICIAGGVALNCVANARILREGGFGNLFIPPDPGDGGACFGAAMHVAQTAGDVKPISHPYLGIELAAEDIAPLVAACPDLSFLLGKEANGVRPASSIELIPDVDQEALVDTVVEDLAAGRIVAWIQGRFEVGPRALGNRSLLVDPAQLESVRRLGKTVKSHTGFRPYALSVSEEDAAEVLEDAPTSQPTMKWMQSVWRVRDRNREKLRGAIHVDGTTRPQICRKEDNPLFWRLLTRFGRVSGISALLNTSLNERSFPMIAQPRAAMATFARTGIDTLVVGNRIFRKHY
jgi:carbamoyltransferase